VNFRRRPSILVTAWIVVGVVIAATHDYFERFETAGRHRERRRRGTAPAAPRPRLRRPISR
jgi:hypothetical protein